MQQMRDDQRLHTGLKHASLGVMVALALAGCGRLGLNDPLAERAPQPTYAPLPAAPAEPVTSSALPPPPPVTAPTASAGTPIDPMAPAQPTAGTAAGIPVASNNPSAASAPSTPDKGGPAISRGDFLGAWRLSSSADNCQLFVSLTSWSGGYRASTKGCSSADFQRIAAWDVSGRQLFLKSGDGAVVATLTPAGQERYAGSTTSKQSVSLSR